MKTLAGELLTINYAIAQWQQSEAYGSDVGYTAAKNKAIVSALPCLAT